MIEIEGEAKELNHGNHFIFVIKMPELLQRLDDASKSLPKMIKREERKTVKFSTEEMVGVLEDWFPRKSSVEIIRDIRESEEL
jgi:hypothetical protein